MKKKVLSLLLGLCLCISFALPLYAIDGPINADDNAELVTPTLEITDAPTGAAAIAHNLNTNQTYYYRMNGYILSSDDGDLCEPGWMPESHSVDGVIGDDNRELVSNTQVAPFSAIAYIRAYYSADDYIESTGSMISPNAVLTAAHSLYNSSKGGWPIRVEVTPAAYGSCYLVNPHAPYGTATAREIVISLPFFENGSVPQWDWGVIRLNSNVGNYSGFLGFHYFDMNVSDLSVMIAGYPADLNNNLATRNQYKHSGLIYYDESSYVTLSNYGTYETRYFEFFIDVTSGQSGSPILCYWEGAYQIIGILSGENTVNGTCVSNDGFALISEVFQFLVTYKNNS